MQPHITNPAMSSTILVTGGTGTLGRHVVRRLRDAGCDIRVLSRHSHSPMDGVEFVTGDLATGEGIQAAVAGVGTVVHCAGGPKGDDDKARNLVRAASRAGVRHLVYISVVGADRVAHKQQLYVDNDSHGDTYGPVNYIAYIPFEIAFPWKGVWDQVPAARAASARRSSVALPIPRAGAATARRKATSSSGFEIRRR